MNEASPILGKLCLEERPLITPAERELKFTRPTATRLPCLSTHSTTSPRSRISSFNGFTPTGNKLRCFNLITSTAPSSITRRPAVLQVRSKPLLMRCHTVFISRKQRTQHLTSHHCDNLHCRFHHHDQCRQPDLAAKRAARTLVTMPPRPDTATTSHFNKASSMARTVDNNFASGYDVGLESNIPC